MTHSGPMRFLSSTTQHGDESIRPRFRRDVRGGWSILEQAKGGFFSILRDVIYEGT
jgi:hypothetical protein